MAKGSRQRPLNISMKVFDNSWDAIFNKPVISNTVDKAVSKVSCVKCVNAPYNKCASNLTK